MAALFLYNIADMLDQTRAYVRRLSFVLEWHRWFAWYPVPLDETEGRLELRLAAICRTKVGYE